MHSVHRHVIHRHGAVHIVKLAHAIRTVSNCVDHMTAATQKRTEDVSSINGESLAMQFSRDEKNY